VGLFLRTYWIGSCQCKDGYPEWKHWVYPVLKWSPGRRIVVVGAVVEFVGNYWGFDD
jgi:hypothetical protein